MAGDDGGRRFAALLREHRLKKDLRQEDVAELSGVSLSTISRWERGHLRNPTPEEFSAVCRVVGLNPLVGMVALGYLSAEDVELPPKPIRQFEPTVEEVIAIFENPEVPEDTKRAALEYMRYLRDKAARQPADERRPRIA